MKMCRCARCEGEGPDERVLSQECAECGSGYKPDPDDEDPLAKSQCPHCRGVVGTLAPDHAPDPINLNDYPHDYLDDYQGVY